MQPARLYNATVMREREGEREREMNHITLRRHVTASVSKISNTTRSRFSPWGQQWNMSDYRSFILLLVLGFLLLSLVSFSLTSLLPSFFLARGNICTVIDIHHMTSKYSYKPHPPQPTLQTIIAYTKQCND